MPYVPPSSSPVKSLPIPRHRIPDTASAIDENKSEEEERDTQDPNLAAKEGTICPAKVTTNRQSGVEEKSQLLDEATSEGSEVSSETISPSTSIHETASLPTDISEPISSKPIPSPRPSSSAPKISRARSTFRQMSQSADLESPCSLPSPSRALATNFAHTTMSDTTPLAPPPTAGQPSPPTMLEPDTVDQRRTSTDSDASVPALSSADVSTSASSASIASLYDESTISSPATSDGVAMGSLDQLSERERGLHHYRERIYAYTRSLYLEAKLSSARNEKKKEAYASFGVKQSGMERLAAKKALARRLNG